MAELAEGVYVIINVNSQKAVDVKGGQDRSGTNVQIWRRDDSDSQIFYISKPAGDNKYEINCSLSIRPLSAQKPSGASVYNVIQVNNTNDTSTQRWLITDTGKTFKYGTVTYPVYRINWAKDTSLGFDVEYFGTADGSNIALHSVGSNPGTNQQWIFKPMDALKEGNYYKIGLASGSVPMLTVANKSTSDGAQVRLEAENDTLENQVFFARKDPATNLFYFEACHSNYRIGIWDPSSKGAAILEPKDKPYVNQLTKPASASHALWLPIRVPGTDGTFKKGDTSYPVYELRSALGNDFDLSVFKNGKASDKRLYVTKRSGGTFGNGAQHFVLIPTEGNDGSMTKPGEILPSSFERDGVGSISVSGLSFTSSYSSFQARYRTVSYNAKKTTNSTSSWKNVSDDSTDRSGWGDFATSTFDQAPVNGIVSLPFSKSFTLNASNAVSIELQIEVRGFIKTDSVIKHGPSHVSTILLTQHPTTTIGSLTIALNDGELGFATQLVNTPAIGVTSVRARLVDENFDPISDYMTSSSLKVVHKFDDLYRLPLNGETVGVDYSMITVDGVIISGIIYNTVSYATVSFNPTISYMEDDSCRAIATVTSHTHDYCYVANQTVDSTRLVKCSQYQTQNGKKSFIVLPSLNTDCMVYFVGSSNGTSWGVATINCRINSHLFIWNWTYKANDHYPDEFSSLLINTDDPPQQTRSYTTDIKFSTPAGRIHPVGFSMSNLSTDLSVSGMVVDDDADYVAAGPLPNHSSIGHLRRLIMLSGHGVHPYYRTPYGDFYMVGIESVDLSKTKLGLSTATVKQRAVKD